MVATRPCLFTPTTRTVDTALCVCLAVVLLQVVPLPPRIRVGLSPSLPTIDRALHLDAPADPTTGPAAPLSVDPNSSLQALVLVATIMMVFWSARHVYGIGGVRRTVRALAACGLTVSTIALVQHVVAPHLLYGIWRPFSRNAQFPFGPFVNRNDFAAWLVMALPLAIGYFTARLEMRRRERRLSVEAVFDGTGVWLAVTICLMAATLLSTLSRSGLLGGVAGAATIVLLTRGRAEQQSRGWLVAGLALVALVAATYANIGALTTRVGEAIESGVGGRRDIWQITYTMAGDFWRTGVGVGGFERAMSVYQPPHLFAFNHAHDEYLQVAAEGGILLVIPALIAMAAGGRHIARLLRADRTPLFWVRAGAASSIVAIAVQSVWETGLRMPANAVLFALCAALAVHDPNGAQEATDTEETDET